MPTTAAKPKQFAFIMAEEEQEMLREVAEADGRPAANWLRMAIRREHAKLVATRRKTRKGAK